MKKGACVRLSSEMFALSINLSSSICTSISSQFSHLKHPGPPFPCHHHSAHDRQATPHPKPQDTATRPDYADATLPAAHNAQASWIGRGRPRLNSPYAALTAHNGMMGNGTPEIKPPNGAAQCLACKSNAGKSTMRLIQTCFPQRWRTIGNVRSRHPVKLPFPITKEVCSSCHHSLLLGVLHWCNLTGGYLLTYKV